MTHIIRLDHETTVIDLLLTAEATGDLPPGSLLVLMADSDARFVLPIGIDDVPDDPPQDERTSLLTSLLDEVASSDLCDGVLLAIGRFGHPRPRGADFGWHDAVRQACRNASLDCHGTYVVTPHGVRRVRPMLAPPELSAA